MFGELLSFELDREDNIINTYDRINAGLPQKIPFATDSGGNFICFDYAESDRNPQIVFWYNEISVSEEDLDEEELENNMLEELQRKVMAYVTDSFTELMNKLY